MFLVGGKSFLSASTEFLASDSDAFCLSRQMRRKYLYCSSVNEIKIPVNATAYISLQINFKQDEPHQPSFPSYCTPNKISVENKRSGIYISLLRACDCFVTVVVFKIIFPP
jgi:hypothetical protein